MTSLLVSLFDFEVEMPQQGREVRAMEPQPAANVRVYSLEEIIALQRALENGISELVVNSPQVMDTAQRTFSPAPAPARTAVQPLPAAPPDSDIAPGPKGPDSIPVVERMKKFLGWVKRKLIRSHRAAQRSA